MHSKMQAVGRLVAIALMALVLVALGNEGAAAETKKRDDFGSRESMKFQCEAYGGTFSEDAYGNLECHHPNGTWIECDENGNDCWITKPFQPLDQPEPWQHPDTQWNPAERMAPITGTTAYHG